MGADVYKSYQKRRRKDDFEPPTVFKLGGNIHDPLNLNGINAGGTNGQATPISSPFPSPFPQPSKEKVEVLIPPNICDPLNLSCPEALNESDLISPTNFIHKRNKRRRTSSENEINEQRQKLEIKSNFHDKSRDDSFLTRRNVSNLNRLNRDKFNNSERKISPAGSKQNIARFSRNNSQSNANRHHNKDGNKKGDRQVTSTATVAEHCPPEASTSTGKPKNNKERFRFGNYNRYYGYRNTQHCDKRLELFPKDLIEGKDVLDVGCNIGHITLALARDYAPRKIVGIDIDPGLIEVAKKNIRHYITEFVVQEEEMPISMPLLYGTLANMPKQKEQEEGQGPSREEVFPNNVFFIAINYVPESDDLLEAQEAEYDCIISLSLTKWIHLNWGDAGIKRMFKRTFRQLRPGGCLVLEPQPWSSYQKKSKLTVSLILNCFSYSNTQFFSF